MAPSTTDPTELAEQLTTVGTDAGLDAIGFASAAPFDDTRHELERRKRAGWHGGMQFTYRNPTRSTDPSRTLPGARSLVVGARSYRSMVVEAERPARTGWVASYARRDVYAELRAALGVVAAHLRAEGWRARVVADDNALVDRAAAHRAGLGWFGKNANLLLPGRGSWFVLGSVITDALLPSAEPVDDGCGSCSRCLTACPTGAIIAPGVIDANRCIAWLVQAPGPIPVELREAVGDRVYGCDDCQDVCPPNRRELGAPVRLEATRARRGDLTAADIAHVDLIALLTASDEQLLAHYGRWYIPERDPRYLRRNALVALGNTADSDDDEVRALLERHAAGSDELLAEHARWALARIEATR